MSKNKKQNWSGKLIFIAIVILVVVILGAVFLFSGKERYSQTEVDVFAKCLTEKGATMYGAFWCPHCAKSKKRFGASFQFIKYVECDPKGDNEQSELCIQKEIENYDTWEFADGSRVVGEPSFETLAQKTGCAMPGVVNG